jgi:xanthine dehydrogenase molybdenum-binding subunit
LPPVLTYEDALAENAPRVHDDVENNLLVDGLKQNGNLEKAFAESDYIYEDTYNTQAVSHCSIENAISYAYVDTEDHIVIVTSTQVPHTCRRVVAQALDIPVGTVRVIKPAVGGGFGNKTDLRLEPLNAALTLAVNGRPVMLDFDREEFMIGTSTRHPFRVRIKTGVTKEGRIKAFDADVITNTGAYASHGGGVTFASGGKFFDLYDVDAVRCKLRSVYTNLPVAGAFRGFGHPQVFFALESHMEDIARRIGIDSAELRKKNFLNEGYIDPDSDNKVLSCGVRECIDKGRALIDWTNKKKEYENQQGPIRRGLGLACFSYGAGTFPRLLEMSCARLVLNQDGSLRLQTGATEIGQGSDTVFAQMVSEVIGVPYDSVYVSSTQDTDITPIDFGAYASRQTYMSGLAVRKAAIEVKEKMLEFARLLTDVPVKALDILDGNIIYKHSGETVMPVSELALKSIYDMKYARPIVADVSNNARSNALSFGATVVEVEVDMRSCKVEVKEIYNVHDSGTIINHQTAAGQVHGGVAQGIGYALSEEMLYNTETGEPYNNNLLDYKMPTTMDVPDIGAAFVETYEPTGPFGNKSLGEPPLLSPAAAIRNAVLDATGVEFNQIPMNPRRVYEAFDKLGLLSDD